MPESPLLFPIHDDSTATATISACGRYRYDLTRTWTADCVDRRRVVFLMLNPSKADALRPDPTMTRCVEYSKAWGYGGLAIVNLFAYRSTDPEELRKADDPIGPENDAHLRRWVRESGLLVLGYGAHPFAKGRIGRVLEIVCEAGAVPHCLKLTKDGYPGHPLFLRADLRPIPMEPNHARD